MCFNFFLIKCVNDLCRQEAEGNICKLGWSLHPSSATPYRLGLGQFFILSLGFLINKIGKMITHFTGAVINIKKDKLGKKPYTTSVKLPFFFFKPIQRHIVGNQTMLVLIF